MIQGRNDLGLDIFKLLLFLFNSDLKVSDRRVEMILNLFLLRSDLKVLAVSLFIFLS